MRLLGQLARDENGLIVSAETALLGTGGVLASVIGIDLLARSANDELRDAAYSFRSLDQSYSVGGHYSPTAWVAGSGFTQRPVDESLDELRREEQRLRDRERELRETERNGGAPADEDGDRAETDEARDLRPDAAESGRDQDPGARRRDRGDSRRDRDEAERDREARLWERDRGWE